MYNKRSLLASIILSLLILCNQMAAAQSVKFCDVALSVHHPEEGQVFDYGDTVTIYITLKNNGPDDLLPTDTIAYEITDFALVSLYADTLRAGDSVAFPNIGGLYNTGIEDDTVTWCFNLDNSLYDTYTDSISSNDSACVTFILKGSHQTGIPDIRRPGTGTLKLFPNPASSTIHIPFPVGNRLSGNISVYVTNMLGTVLLSRDYGQVAPQTQSLPFHISKLEPGLYWVILMEDGKKYAGKLLIR